MPTDQASQLPPDFSARVARLVGWTEVQQISAHKYWGRIPTGEYCAAVPDFENDLNAWEVVHEKLAERELHVAFIGQLLSEMPRRRPRWGDPIGLLVVWDIARATAQQRSLALWRTGVLGE